MRHRRRTLDYARPRRRERWPIETHVFAWCTVAGAIAVFAIVFLGTH